MTSCEVLVTGGHGFIGRALMARLASEGVTGVVGIDRSDFDLADPDATRRHLAELQPRTVVHLAASLHRDPSPESRRAQWRDTFAVGRNVIESSVELGVAHLLFAGSADELGDQAGVLGPEVPARPITVYGLCKSLLRELADFHARACAMRLDWFRPFHVYGVGQRGSSLIAYACEAASANAAAEFTDGTQSRDFVYVDDVVDWLVAGVRSTGGEADTNGLIMHHLGTGVATPVRDVLAAIAAEFPSSRFQLGALPRRPREPDCQIAPPPETAASSQWRWAPRVSLAEGIARTAAWWRAGAGDR
jgi:nucleoside-diphosphate-sugar epimerase